MALAMMAVEEVPLVGRRGFGVVRESTVVEKEAERHPLHLFAAAVVVAVRTAHIDRAVVGELHAAGKPVVVVNLERLEVAAKR